MSNTRMTAPIRRSLQVHMEDLDRRIEMLDVQREGDDSPEATALLEQLRRERSDIADALRDATLIDDEPFDTKAIEIGDTVTIRNPDGETDRYVLVDSNVRSRARTDWVSVSSPLGAAILGRSKGDHVQVESPGGTMPYVIVDFARASENAIVPAASNERAPTDPRSLLGAEAFLG